MEADRNLSQVAPIVGCRDNGHSKNEDSRSSDGSIYSTIQRWGIDLIGLLPKTQRGNRWIITAIDYATGWPVAKAVPNATKTLLRTLFSTRSNYMHYGAPQEIVGDGGENLWGEVVQAFLRRIGTAHKVSRPCHPRTNGIVERLNGIIGGIILSKLFFGKPTKL